MIYSTLGECWDATAKLGHLAKGRICASVSGLDDKFLSHLALMLSRAGETGLEGIDAVVVAELLELEDYLEVIECEQPPIIIYMYLPKLQPLLPLPFLLFECPPVVFAPTCWA